MTAGDIYTVAGNGTAGFSGDGGPATAAELDSPADGGRGRRGQPGHRRPGNNRVRVVAASTGTFYGQAMTAGRHLHRRRHRQRSASPATAARPPAPSSSAPAGVAVDARGQPGDRRHRQQAGAGGGGQHRHVLRPGDDRRGHLHRGRDRHRRVLRRRRPGRQRRAGPAPPGWRVDAAGNLVIADTGNKRVRVVAARTGTFYGQAMTAGRHLHRRRDRHPGFSGDGGPATAAELDTPGGRGGGRRGQPGDRRHRQQPDPGGGRGAPARSTARR